MAEETIKIWNDFLPLDSKLVIIDDNSVIPIKNSDYRFEKQAGIAKAKNKCLELLDDCEHIFLADDDIYPLVKDWHTKYIASGIKHLMFTFKELKSGLPNGHRYLGTEDGISRFSHPCGCLLYIHRSVLDVVGGFDERFGIYSHEHVNYSDRVYNNRLTEHRYQDIENSTELFYSLDWAREVSSSVKGRRQRIRLNDKLLQANRNSKAYMPYKPLKTAIITTYFTGVNDPQRESKWEADHSKLSKLIKSMNGQQLIIIHDCFDLPDTENVKYVKVESAHNPYFQRWISLTEYLSENIFDYVFMVDSTDVTMINNPFKEDLGNYLYVGDEKQIVGCKWLKENHNSDIEDSEYHSFYETHKGRTLLNAGIVGGKASIVLYFATKIKDWYLKNNGEKLFTDMPIFNFIAYTQFRKNLKHGVKINTEFKKYDMKNTTSWFRHK